jgi:hypothetical protein
MDLREFIESKHRNAWLPLDGIDVYVRRSKRLIDGKFVSCLDLANMTAHKTGRGAWTRFIEMVKSCPEVQTEFQFIFVENVLTQQFADWFRRNKWREITCDFNTPSFYWSIHEN